MEAASETLRVGFDSLPDGIVAHGLRFADLLAERVKPSRERSLAITNLEQAMLWAQLAIEREREQS